MSFTSTISTFSELFTHLTLWIEEVSVGEVARDGIEKIGLKEFKTEVVLNEEIKERLKSLLKKPTDEQGGDAGEDWEEIKKVCDMLVEMECCEDFENK